MEQGKNVTKRRPCRRGNRPFFNGVLFFMGEQRVENLVLLWSRITFQALSSFFFHRWLSLKSLSKLHGKITLFGFLFYINNQFLTVASCPLKSQKKKKYQDISVGDTVVHISTALGDIFPVREKQSAALKSSSFFLLWMQQSEGLSSLLSVYLMYFFPPIFWMAQFRIALPDGNVK